MTDRLISALIPPKINHEATRRIATESHNRVRVTPASMAPIRQRISVYSVASIDDRGKIWAHHVLAGLGWEPSTSLTLTERSGLLVLAADVHGTFRLTSTGHLRIPSSLRHWYGRKS